jgi:hypothetical protein
MKKTILLSCLCLTFLSGRGQVTSLNENMNTTCPSGAYSPTGWMTFNPISTSDYRGKWTCDLPGGRSGTPGISCSGLYGSPLTYHLDTSILVSPPMNLSSNTTIYINFDTKTTNFNLGAKLEMLISADSTMGTDTATIDTFTVYNKTTAMTPLFDNSDESDWVTHQVDITAYKDIVPLYVGFRYSSAAGSSGSRWYLDNINTTTIPLDVSRLPLRSSGFTVAGSANNGKMNLICHSPASGDYNLSVYDIAGRLIHQQELHLTAGQNSNIINGISLTPGIYVVKMGNESTFATARINAW